MILYMWSFVESCFHEDQVHPRQVADRWRSGVHRQSPHHHPGCLVDPDRPGQPDRTHHGAIPARFVAVRGTRFGHHAAGLGRVGIRDVATPPEGRVVQSAAVHDVPPIPLAGHRAGAHQSRAADHRGHQRPGAHLDRRRRPVQGHLPERCLAGRGSAVAALTLRLHMVAPARISRVGATDGIHHPCGCFLLSVYLPAYGIVELTRYNKNRGRDNGRNQARARRGRLYW